jgi:hypothetical protein
MENLNFSEIIGILLFAVPFFLYMTQVLFDGIGGIKDIFYTSNRHQR